MKPPSSNRSSLSVVLPDRPMTNQNAQKYL